MRGKAGKSEDTSLQLEDHPRTCGEKLLCRYFSGLERGSPPHMRGKVYILANKKGLSWITPAHAGKSSIEVNDNNIGRDHPRTCGEKDFVLEDEIDRRGSPPHMRGKAMGRHTPH